MTPVLDNVIIHPSDSEKITPGGILIPDAAQEKPKTGLVLGVGPGRYDENGNRVPMQVKIGDKVLYCKNLGTDLTINEVKIIIIREDAILGVIE
jgi:chaperonin GroES